MKKRITITILTIIFVLMNNTCTLASVTWDDIQKNADGFISKGAEGADLISIQDTVGSVGQILTTIGLAVVLVGILILGIKYMMASPEEAAKIKGQLVGLVISAIVIFGAWGIWSLVVNALQRVTQ